MVVVRFEKEGWCLRGGKKLEKSKEYEAKVNIKLSEQFKWYLFDSWHSMISYIYFWFNYLLGLKDNFVKWSR